MKLTREEVLAQAVRGLVDRIAELEAGLAKQKSVNADYVHIIREHQERISKYEACQSAGAVAPGECVSVPDEQIAWNVWNDCHYVVRQSTDIKQATWSLTLQREQIVRRAQSKAGMQPPNNQQNLICKSCGVDRSKEDCKGDRLRCGLAGIAYSDHVAVISAKPDSVHLAVPTETSTNPRLRGSHIKGTLDHDAGAYACCSYCGRYSDNLGAIRKSRFMCDCGRDAGWSGSFKRPTAASTWSGPESGISSTPFRPNEQNDAVGQEGKQ